MTRYKIVVSVCLSVDAVTELAREGILSELLYVDDLFLIETTKGLMNKFRK